MSNSKVSSEDKLCAVKLYLSGKESQNQIAARLNVTVAFVQQWIYNYESMGSDVFFRKKSKKYSLELKRQAVLEYLSGQGSQTDICRKYGIRSKSKLHECIKKYNGHELKASPGGSTIMTKGRKTTLEERIEIVSDCIASDLNYEQTAEKHHVSYQQVYQWVRKYKEHGVNGLVDRRGRNNPVEEMSEIEKLKVENKILKAQLDRKELENLFLKKLDEIERRRY